MQLGEAPAVVERVCNHGGWMLKCYVIGSHIFMQGKASLPDAAPDQPMDGSALRLGSFTCPCQPPFVLRFNSLQGLPALGKAPVDATDQHVHAARKRAAESTAAAIRQHTGLCIFGFDLVEPVGVDAAVDARHVLLDVNAFPSFNGIDGAADALRESVKEMA